MELMQGVEFSHWVIDNCICNYDILIDATCGNGYDSMYLAYKINDGGKLYLFDIQKEAINNTKRKLTKIENREFNTIYINDGHQYLDKYIKEPIDCIIYNLGYLPGLNKRIKTKKESTILSLKKSLKLLNNKGLIILVIYSGHQNGELERNAVIDLASNLNYKKYNVLHYHFINQKNKPSEVVVVKNRGNE